MSFIIIMVIIIIIIIIIIIKERNWVQKLETVRGPVILAHLLASGPDELGKNPAQAIQIRSRLDLHNTIQAFFGRMELNCKWEVGSRIYSPAQFWLHAGQNGHNWP